MRTLAFTISTPAALLFAASCVVTDVDEASPSNGGAGGDVTGTGASGGNKQTGGGSTGGDNGEGGNGDGGSAADTFGIDCGADVCNSGDVCCVTNGEPMCTTEELCVQLNAASSQTGPGILMKCDDLADCNGKACCVRGDSTLHIYECADSGTCELFESCSSELVCTVPGDDCVLAKNGGSNHKCVNGGASVECGGDVCAGPAPVCCNSGSSACVAHGDPCNSAFECDGGSDCGGSLCCASTNGSSCLGECSDPFILCDAIGDCPSSPTMPSGCELNANVGPSPGYKVCVYP